jgi:hypothetical protein
MGIQVEEFANNIEMESVFHDDEINEQGEIIFKTDIADKPEKSWWHLIPIMFALGAIVGIFMWYQFDRQLNWIHLIAWISGGGFVLCGILSLPYFHKSNLKEIRIFEEGFRIIDTTGTQSFFWRELDAAYFEIYPVANMGTSISCFEFRVKEKNYQIMIDGLGERKIKLFWMVMDGLLGRHEIPKEAKGFRSFQYYLSMIGLWVFIGGVSGIVIAHLLILHTLGTIFGLSVMFVGAAMALMTWRQTMSKWVILATVAAVMGTIVYIHVYDVDVQQTLQQWERREREHGRPPWSDIQQPQQPDETTSDTQSGPGT